MHGAIADAYSVAHEISSIDCWAGHTAEGQAAMAMVAEMGAAALAAGQAEIAGMEGGWQQYSGNPEYGAIMGCKSSGQMTAARAENNAEFARTEYRHGTRGAPLSVRHCVGYDIVTDQFGNASMCDPDAIGNGE